MSVSDIDVERFKKRLLEKERELVLDVTRLRAEVRLAGETEVGDPTDRATASEAASESAEEDANAAATLVQVREALLRIEKGTYGRCIIDGKRIEPARLEAVPWTPYCLEDQEKQDAAAHVPQGGATL